MLTTDKNYKHERMNRSVRLTKSSWLYQKSSNLLYRHCKFIPSDQKYNITLSKSHRFVWYRIGKVGTRTILDTLDQAGVSLTAEHPFWVRYAPHSYEDYFKFTFVRNPWDRIVSCWKNKVKEADFNYFRIPEEEKKKLQDFGSFVDFVIARGEISMNDPHLRAQSSMIDLNHVDFIGRFENFEEDLRKVLTALKIDNVEIPKKNATASRKTYHDYYDNITRDKVAEIYAKDIELFNYQFD